MSAKLVNDNGTRFAQFSVEDTGVGIKKDEQQKLFRLFGMLDTNKALNKNGCGIGLTVSQKFAEALGGKIWIESEFEKGTCVIFRIPYPSRFQKYEEAKESYNEFLSQISEGIKDEDFNLEHGKQYQSQKIELLKEEFCVNASRNVLGSRVPNTPQMVPRMKSKQL